MPSITHDIRQHHRIPPTLPTPARRIFIKHPGYSPSPDLLWLYAYDKVPGTELWGCSHRIALDACRIITNNRDGFLSTTQRRQDKIPDNDLTLTADVYYYFIAAPDEADYPVVADFTAWRFPELLPDHWRSAIPSPTLNRWYGAGESAMSSTVKALDGACILSGFDADSSCDNAYLIPKEQGAWFAGNRMHVYNRNPSVVQLNDIANGVCLRADIHRCLDRAGFIFFPIDTQFVAYVIRLEPDYAEWYHRTPAHIHERVSIPFLYARFAYNIISISQIALSATAIVLPIKTVSPTLQIASAAQRSKRTRSRSTSATSSEQSMSEQAASDAVVPLQYAEDDQSPARIFAARFPHLQQEVACSNDHDFNTLAWHPEVGRMEELKTDWFSRNPLIRQTSLSEGDMSLTAPARSAGATNRLAER